MNRRVIKSIGWLSAILLFAFSPAVNRCKIALDQEHRVKAAFIFNFAKFIDFPTGSFSSPDAAFEIGVYGKDDYGRDLVDTLEGKQIQGHRFVVHHVVNDDDIKACRFLIIGESDSGHLHHILNLIRGAPVVSIGEGTSFVKEGGILSFVMEGERIRFDVNLAAARNASIFISSRMVGLAQEVIQ